MTTTELADGRVVLHGADCRDVLRGLADNSIDSVVTDPPYALVSIVKRFGKPGSAPVNNAGTKAGNKGDPYARAARGFMGKTWDNGEVAFSEEFWAEVLRVLKPGGHVVAFSGTRTYHRMAVAIEDAGFEVRDQLGWLYGSGFPKSHNQHDDWEGWGTALKPAWEPIALARKPLEGTVAANLAKWGVGALNIDGCRVEGTPEPTRFDPAKHGHDGWRMDATGEQCAANASPLGRWPANIVHDGSDEVVAAFPDAKGQQGKVGPEHGAKDSRGIYGDFGPRDDFPPRVEADKSAARFFYCAKASRADRDEGLEGFEVKRTGGMSATADGSMLTGSGNERTTSRANIHPTVKPTSLMRWLCRLVTPPGGIILDPFMGSGSTGKAAVWEGMRFIGCEREEEYIPIAEARIRYAVDNPPGAVKKKPANDNTPPAQAGGDLFSSAGGAA